MFCITKNGVIMRKYLKLFLVIVLFSMVLGNNIHDFKLRDLNNKRISFSEVKGEKLTIIDFWATWCKPCLRAIPKLIDIQEKYQTNGVQVIGINVDSPRNVAKVKPLSKSLGINYPVLLDTNNEVMTDLHISVVPTLLIVNSDNKVVYSHQGFRPGDENEIIKKIEELLNENI